MYNSNHWREILLYFSFYVKDISLECFRDETAPGYRTLHLLLCVAEAVGIEKYPPGLWKKIQKDSL